MYFVLSIPPSVLFDNPGRENPTVLIVHNYYPSRAITKPQGFDHALNKSANLVEDGIEDGDNSAGENTSGDELTDDNSSKSAPKMDAEAVKALLKEVREENAAQIKQT